MKKSKAFTLIELLVVISIIGILAVGAGASYTVSQKRARDARRKTDVKNIAAALEQYYSVCGYQYPASITFGTGNITCASPSIIIMNPVPADPSISNNYVYSHPDGTNSSFRIVITDMETEADGYTTNNQQ